MNEKNIEAFLSLLSVHNGTLKGDWVIASCPAAFARHKSGKDDNPSFGIFNNPTGRSGYNCFSCNLRGNSLGDLLVELVYETNKFEGAPYMELAKAFELVEHENEQGYVSTEWSGKVVDAPEFEAWPEWWLETFMPASKNIDAMEYLISRGITPATVKALDLRYDTSKKTVCFPFRNASGDLAGMRGRFLTPSGNFRHYDYKCNGVSNTATTWMGENHINFLKPIIVVEGQFDYATVFRVYRNVMANLTTSLSWPKVNKLKSAVEVIEMFDYDVAGRTAGNLLEEQLKGTAVHHFDYKKYLKSEKDTDPAEIGAGKLGKFLSDYVVLDKPIP